MGFVVLGAVLAAIFVSERGASLLRKARFERDRASADYPITGNDPTGRIIV